MNIQCVHEKEGAPFKKGMIYKSEFVGDMVVVTCEGVKYDLSMIASIGITFKDVSRLTKVGNN